MSGKTILVWFRNDLRIHDNEILLEATIKATQIIPVYVFDPRYYQETSLGSLKTGKFRAKFILESVSDLKQSLQKLGGDLLVLRGKPEELLPQLVKEYHVDEVYHHREVATDETEISSKVEDALWEKNQINLKHFIGHTLYHKEDLPFPIKDIPDVFSKFRKKAEREGQIRPVFTSPEKIVVPTNLKQSEVPCLENLGFNSFEEDQRSVLDFKGGESAGLKRLHNYLWESEEIKKFNSKKHTLIALNYSSKLSPWLAVGCISPREVYWKIKKYEKENGANDASQFIVLELLWRDYFRFMYKKHGTNYFLDDNEESKSEIEKKKELFQNWKNGHTGLPFIDANMQELNLTGFMGYKGRQSVASFLVNDLKINWIWGASYFEEMLIDYSPASNLGNWAYAAGLSNDPKENKNLNVFKQAKESDPRTEYVKRWLPEFSLFTPEELLEKNTILLQKV